MEDRNRILTVQETADWLKVSPTTVRRLIRKGKLPAFRVGPHWRLRRCAVRRALIAR